MTLLLASIAALALGPLAYKLAGRGRAMLSVLDGFVLAAIGALVLFSVLPETMALGGWATIAFLAAGFAGPTMAETLFRRAAKHTHVVALALGLLGLSLHALLDGATLGGVTVGGDRLSAAVVVHRFPVGLVIWWLLRPHFGAIVAALVLGIVAAATTAGYALGAPLVASLSTVTIAWVQAFVAGSLLHVVFFKPHLEDAGDHHRVSHAPRLEGVGAILGLALVAVILASGDDEARSGLQIAETFVALGRETAPALLLAYVAAGLISAFLSTSSTGWMSRGGAAGQAVKGMTFGLPLPICSCGVVPLYRTLIMKGVPPTAAMAFLVATPELGLDAVFISIPLLGPHMTIIRVVGAAVVAFAVGWWVGKITPAPSLAAPSPPTVDGGARQSFGDQLRGGLRTGLTDVVDDTAPWILAGLGIAALVAPFLEHAPLAAIPAGFDIILFALLGVPTYVCASAATPMVAALITGGLSPGAALAFLITGPATNVTTFGVLSQLHGRRAAAIFSLAIVGLSVSLGYLVNAFLGDITRVSLATLSSESTSPLQTASLIGLAFIFGMSLVRRGPRGFLGELSFSGG